MADEIRKKPAVKKKAPSQQRTTKAGPEKPTINDAAEWAKVRGEWAKDKYQTAQAHADRFFTTDEELPLSQHVILVMIAAFFVMFFLWANFAELDERTRGQGKVIPSSEIQKLQSLEGGIVDEFMVREGDNVKAGQVLMRLRDIQAASDLGANRKKYLGLLAKVERLKAEAEGLDRPSFADEVMQGAPDSVKEEMKAFTADMVNLRSQTVVLEQQLTQKQQEVSGLETRVRDLQQSVALARKQRNITAPLVERGSAPKLELLQLDRDIQNTQTDLNSAQASLTQAQSAVNEAQARIAELKSSSQAQAQTDLSSTMIEMNSVKETLSGLEDRKVRTEIRSPVDGTIKDIMVNTVGGVVKPGEDLIEIVPRNDQLIIEASVKPRDIAFLHPGQKVMIKLTAYDFSIYGGLKGELIDISADTLTNQKGETFYRIRVRTNETSLKRKGEVLQIIPGMVATVDILTGKKTVMEYIMKPLIKTVDNAMHER